MSTTQLPELTPGACGDLGTLEARAAASTFEALRQAVGAPPDVTASIVVREYARLLWSRYRELLAITTAYETTIHRVLAAPDRLRVSGSLLESSIAGDRWRVIVQTEIRGSGGELFASNLVQLAILEPVREPAQPRPEPSRAPRRDDEATLSTDHPVSTERVTREQSVALEAATSGFWPDHASVNIHTDEKAATSTGITDGRFASGMLTCGLVLKHLAATDPAWFERDVLSMKFRKPVPEGATIRIGRLPADTSNEAGSLAVTIDRQVAATATLRPR